MPSESLDKEYQVKILKERNSLLESENSQLLSKLNSLNEQTQLETNKVNVLFSNY